MAIDTIKATAIFDGTVDTADLADDAVTTAKINAGAVDTTELADSAVTNAKIDGMASSKLSGAISVDGSASDDSVNVDSSGNLLVGTTSAVTPSGTSAGSTLHNEGYLLATRSLSDATDSVAYFNRLTSDGELISLRKDGSEVGSIGIVSGTSDNIFITGNSTHGGVQFGTDIVTPAQDGSAIDDTIDLGATTLRWKDLYLSGGAYLGGTTSSNYLDDYEEGTWTPDLQFNTGNSGITYSSRGGYYTKIGNVVSIWGYCVLTSKGSLSGVANISNLPITPHNSGNNHMFGTFAYANNMSSAPQTNHWVLPYYSGRMYIRYSDTGGEGNFTNSHFTNSSNFGFTATYRAS